MVLRCCSNTCQPFDESGCLGLQPKMGGRSHPKLNILERPIAKKYRDGKVKRTLKRRLKVLETVKSETDIASNRTLIIPIFRGCLGFELSIFIGTGSCPGFLVLDCSIWLVYMSASSNVGGDASKEGRFGHLGGWVVIAFVENLCVA
jgi:hypothetical protein